MKTILVTGVAGFIGHALAKSLLRAGYFVIGVDNLCGDLEVHDIKDIRISELIKEESFVFYKNDITEDLSFLNSYNFELIVHLAAHAGVRQSMNEPKEYIQTNITGFVNVLEYAHKRSVKRLIYASSSSIYGNHNTPQMNFMESDISEFPESVYAMTKKSNEMLAYIYSKTYNIQTIGLRFFSVYGPYGRPDMAPWLFAKSLMDGVKPTLFNSGDMYRDFTFIDDVVASIRAIIDSNGYLKKYQVYNIGASSPHSVLELFETIRDTLGVSGSFINVDAPQGDVNFTSANMSLFRKTFDVAEFLDFKTGILKFCEWFKEYYFKQGHTANK